MFAKNPANPSSTLMTVSMTSMGTFTNLGSMPRMSKSMVPCCSALIASPGPPMGSTLFSRSVERMHSACKRKNTASYQLPIQTLKF